MPRYRCCQVLMRKMSPLVVGLIVHLILSSASATNHQSEIQSSSLKQHGSMGQKTVPYGVITDLDSHNLIGLMNKMIAQIKASDVDAISSDSAADRFCVRSLAYCKSLVKNIVSLIYEIQAKFDERTGTSIIGNTSLHESKLFNNNDTNIPNNRTKNFDIILIRQLEKYIKKFLHQGVKFSELDEEDKILITLKIFNEFSFDYVQHSDVTMLLNSIYKLSDHFNQSSQLNFISKEFFSNAGTNNDVHLRKREINKRLWNTKPNVTLIKKKNALRSSFLHHDTSFEEKSVDETVTDARISFDNSLLRSNEKKQRLNHPRRFRRGRNYNIFDEMKTSENSAKLDLNNDNKRSSENDITASVIDNTTPNPLKYDKSSIYPFTALFNPKRHSSRRQSISSNEGTSTQSPTLYEILRPRLRFPPDSIVKVSIKNATSTAAPSTFENEIEAQNETVVLEEPMDVRYASTELIIENPTLDLNNISKVVEYLSEGDRTSIKMNSSHVASNVSAINSLKESVYAANNTIFIDVMGSVLRHQHSAATVPSHDLKIDRSEDFLDMNTEGSEPVGQSAEDPLRRPKMSDRGIANNTPLKKDVDAKTRDGRYSVPEFRPGSFIHYSDIFQRMPILDARRPNFGTRHPILGGERRSDENRVTQSPMDEKNRVKVMSSTFYPNRMKDIPLKFGSRYPTTVTPTIPTTKLNPKLKEDPSSEESEDDEYRDAIDPGFTMEKLAYLLIGTCCGLSILCLCVVMVAIRCRRVLVEKRLKSRFRKKLFHHNHIKSMGNGLPWQQQFLDHYMYLHGHPDSSCSSRESCNCRCVTWSLGARNLDTRPILCPTNNRNSLYLCGQKKLPFGAASTLRYESMLGRKRPSSSTRPKEEDNSPTTPNPDSSHENDSLDQDSEDSRNSPTGQCTCIDYPVWPVHHREDARRFGPMCPMPGRCMVMGDCHPNNNLDLQAIARDCPPPVTGSNYLDRSEGVVYWSSNDERLI